MGQIWADSECQSDGQTGRARSQMQARAAIWSDTHLGVAVTYKRKRTHDCPALRLQNGALLRSIPSPKHTDALPPPPFPPSRAFAAAGSATPLLPNMDASVTHGRGGRTNASNARHLSRERERGEEQPDPGDCEPPSRCPPACPFRGNIAHTTPPQDGGH